MIIGLPTINKKAHFSTIAALYDAFASNYNHTVKIERENGDRTRNTLKSTHRELFFALVNCAYAQMTDAAAHLNKSFLQMNSRTPYSIRTSRCELSMRTWKSEASIWRQIDRLLDAGILVKKVNHGPTMKFELFINPDILLISDAWNDSYDPIADVIATTENQLVANRLRSFCTEYCNYTGTLNNRVIQEQKKVQSAKPAPTEEVRASATPIASQILVADAPRDKNIRQGHGSKPVAIGELLGVQAKQIDESTTQYAESQPESYADKLQRIDEQRQKRTRHYAVLLVNYVLQHLYADREVYQGQVVKAFEVAEWYFKDCMSNAAATAALEGYKERVRIVERWLERNPGAMSNVWPAFYLDPHNVTSGFINTEKWAKRNDKYKRYQRMARLLRTEDAQFQFALEKMMQYHNLASYQYGQQYILKKIPHRLADYNRACAEISGYRGDGNE